MLYLLQSKDYQGVYYGNEYIRCKMILLQFYENINIVEHKPVQKNIEVLAFS